jgi:threonine/homoserine/homoserine lactone efflux protein
MAAFYYGLGFFILTSVSIAIAGLFGVYRWLPIPIGVVGIMFLFWGSLLMLKETRMATATVNAEMDFVWELANKVTPKSVISKYRRRGRFSGMSTARKKNGSRVSKTLGDE